MAKDVSQTTLPQTKPAAPVVGTPPVSAKVAPKKGGSSLGVWIAFLFVLVVVGAAGWYFFMPHAQTASDSASASGGKSKRGGASDIVRVVTAKATIGNIGVYLTGLGSVTPLNTVTVKSRVDGQLMKVLFQEGQMVKEGDLLIQLDDRPYQTQLAQFKAQKEHDQALLDNAKIDLQRYQTLWSQDSIPQQTLATQEALVKQDQGTVDSDQAQIETVQLNIVYCNITAPISGRVGLRLVDQGNQVHAADTTGLLVITQIQPITVIFTIPEDSVPDVMAKLTGGQTLTVDAYSRDWTPNDKDPKKKLAEGTLLTTDNQIDQTTGTLKLKALFLNTHDELFPNQFVNVRLLVEMKKDVTLVPVAAIQHGTQNSTFVYIVNPQAEPPADAPAPEPAAGSSPTADAKPARATNTVKLQNVVLGTVEGDEAEIQSGLSPGDTVVTDGVDKLQNGSKVIVSDPDNAGKHGGKKTDKSADTASAGAS